MLNLHIKFASFFSELMRTAVCVTSENWIKVKICLLLLKRIYTQYMASFSYFFADNTYVSSSENDEDVLVTTDPIPVIFHRIATGNSNFLYLLL